jgi:streptogramin lyase
LGSDGNLWFGDRGRDTIGRITPTGAITEFKLGLDPEGLALGPDGNVWVAERLALETGAIALNKGSEPVAIASGTDGNLWFTDYGSIGLRAGSGPERIAPGPDGSMWFANDGEARSVGRITPSGIITEFSAGIRTAAV